MPSKPRSSFVALSCVLLLSILLSSCGILSGLGLGGGTPSIPDLPAPPQIPSLTSLDPAARAAELANMIDQAATEGERLAAWLAVYQSLGIPVIAEDGSAVTNTGDDPIGPLFWVIWYFSEADYLGRGIPLTDVARAMAGLEPETDSTQAGQLLLEDLRAAAVSSDSYTGLFGLFIRERIWRGHPGMDMMDTAWAPDALTVDAATAFLMGWPYFRQLFYAAAVAGQSTSSLHLSAAIPHSAAAAPLAESTTCTEFFNGTSRR